MERRQRMEGGAQARRRAGRAGLALFAALLAVALAPVPGAAQTGRDLAETPVDARPWAVDARLRNTFRSHTSFEFGHPLVPGHTPLSRLEFPLNAMWAGIGARGGTSRFSVGMEVLRSVTGEASGMMKDSDWDDLENRELLTIYSESHCRLEPSYLVTGEVDLRVGDWLGLPPRFDLRPVAGIRWQRFVCIAHDGLQVYPASGGALAPLDLSGHTLRFEQVYWHHFLGLKVSWDMGRLWVIPRLVWRIQGDWALVEGVNEDWHMLRLGRRITQERTRGDAWHALAGVKMGLTRNLHVCVEADYLRILTTGSHRLFNPLFDLDYSFEYGVKVWSEQMGLTMSLEWTF